MITTFISYYNTLIAHSHVTLIELVLMSVTRGDTLMHRTNFFCQNKVKLYLLSYSQKNYYHKPQFSAGNRLHNVAQIWKLRYIKPLMSTLFLNR